MSEPKMYPIGGGNSVTLYELSFFEEKTSSTQFKWTSQKPMECGYYWVKGKRPHTNPRMMRFVIGKLLHGNMSRIQPEDGPLSTEGWEWFAGPIPKPI